MQKRHSDRERYFQELANTSRSYYLDYLKPFKEIGDGCRVLEVGCGEGGNLLPFAERGCNVAGIDLSEGKIAHARRFFEAAGQAGSFRSGNFLHLPAPADEAERYDLILIHDVIEHIEAPQKKDFMLHTKKFLRQDGIVFWGFPAWQMPFGGHQQLCRSRICSALPFVHLLPGALYPAFLRLFGEAPASIKELMSIKRSKTSIESFEKLSDVCGYRIRDRLLWFINPHYKQKFGLPPIRLGIFFSKLPYFRNFLSTSCFYISTIKEAA